MEKIKNISSHFWDYKAMDEKRILLNEVIKGDSDLSAKAKAILDQFEFLINSEENLKIVIEKILDFMDQHEDLDKATNIKYRLNITTSKTGIKFYQLKGAIGYEGKKKLWVSISLGNENSVLKKYGTTEPEKLKTLLFKQMVWKTYEKFRLLRLK